MKRLIGLPFLLVFLLSNPSSALNLDFLHSVFPLQKANGLAEDGTLIYQYICTAVSINERSHLWLTAAHCVLEPNEEGTGWVVGTRFIGTRIMSVSVPVVVIEADGLRDLAVFQTPEFYVPSVKLGKQVRYGQDILVLGHPLGYKDLFLTRGWVSNPSAEIDPSDRRKMIINVTGAPGSSGSPIFNTKGELVSILQIGWGRSFSPVTVGALFDDIKTVAGKYFQSEE